MIRRDPTGLGGKDYPLPKEGDEVKDSKNKELMGTCLLGKIQLVKESLFEFQDLYIKGIDVSFLELSSRLIRLGHLELLCKSPAFEEVTELTA